MMGRAIFLIIFLFASFSLFAVDFDGLEGEYEGEWNSGKCIVSLVRYPEEDSLGSGLWGL